MRLRLVILSRLECDVMTELKEEEWLVRRVEKREGKDPGKAEVRLLLFGLQGDHFCCHTLLPAC